MALRDYAVRRGLHVSEYGVLDDASGDHAPLRDRGGGLRAARDELHRARAAREPRRAGGGAGGTLPRAGDGRGPAGRPALPHDRLRRHRVDRGDGAAPHGTAGYEYLCDHRPLGVDGLRGGGLRPIGCARRSSGSAATRVPGVELLPAQRSTSCLTARSTTPTSCCSTLDWVVASVHTSFRMRRAEMTAADRARRSSIPTSTASATSAGARSSAAALRVRLRSGARCGAAHRHDARDQREPRPPRPQRAPRAGRGRGRGFDRDQLRRPPDRRL